MLPRADRQAGVSRRFGAAPGEARTLAVIVHPGSLPHGVYGPLAEALPEDAALLVVDLERIPEYFEAALRGGEARTSVDELAARVADEVEAAEPPERVVLAGWSFGGVVANAAAPRVAPVRLVVLDSIAAVDAFEISEDELEDAAVLRWFVMYLGTKRGAPLDVPYERLAGRPAIEGLEVVLEAALASGALRPGTTMPGLCKVYEAYLGGLRRNQRLAEAHRPPVSQVPLHLVKPQESLMPESPTLGWDELAAAGFEVHGCPADHYSMVTDPTVVGLVGRLLDADIDARAALTGAGAAGGS